MANAPQFACPAQFPNWNRFIFFFFLANKYVWVHYPTPTPAWFGYVKVTVKVYIYAICISSCTIHTQKSIYTCGKKKKKKSFILCFETLHMMMYDLALKAFISQSNKDDTPPMDLRKGKKLNFYFKFPFLLFYFIFFLLFCLLIQSVICLFYFL